MEWREDRKEFWADSAAKVKIQHDNKLVSSGPSWWKVEAIFNSSPDFGICLLKKIAQSPHEGCFLFIITCISTIYMDVDFTDDWVMTEKLIFSGVKAL